MRELSLQGGYPALSLKRSVEITAGLRLQSTRSNRAYSFPLAWFFTGIVRRERMVRNSDPNPASELLVSVRS